MQKVTCAQCRNEVQISPDSDHCSACGENLRDLLDSEFVSGYFYERARDTAIGGNMIEALAEAERGLRQQQSMELHLLAAILAHKMERYDAMRHHVAAIPVDDPLRPEAEWLIRSHQDHQRAIRENIRKGRAAAKRGPEFTHAQTVGLPDEFNRSNSELVQGRRRWRVWLRLAALAALLAAIVLAINFWSALPGSEQVAGPAIRDWLHELIPVPEAADGAPVAVGPAAADSRGEQPETSTVAVAANTDVDRQEATINETRVVASSDLAGVVATQFEPYDLGAFLRANGYRDLTRLPVSARVRGSTLVLDGIVYMDIQRRLLLEAVRKIPEISEVNSVDLLLRPLPAYTVQAGDTLYSIVYDIYGDFGRADEFYEYNSHLLRSRNHMPTGVELRVPPTD